MTSRYRCPWCDFLGEGPDRFLSHLFGYHRDLIRERLAMTGSLSTRKPPDPPRNALERHSRVYSKRETDAINKAVSGEGDS